MSDFAKRNIWQKIDKKTKPTEKTTVNTQRINTLPLTATFRDARTRKFSQEMPSGRACLLGKAFQFGQKSFDSIRFDSRYRIDFFRFD